MAEGLRAGRYATLICDGSKLTIEHMAESCIGLSDDRYRADGLCRRHRRELDYTGPVLYLIIGPCEYYSVRIEEKPKVIEEKSVGVRR